MENKKFRNTNSDKKGNWRSGSAASPDQKEEDTPPLLGNREAMVPSSNLGVSIDILFCLDILRSREGFGKRDEFLDPTCPCRALVLEAHRKFSLLH